MTICGYFFPHCLLCSYNYGILQGENQQVVSLMQWEDKMMWSSVWRREDADGRKWRTEEKDKSIVNVDAPVSSGVILPSL